EVRTAAIEFVKKDLALKGAEDTPDLISKLVDLLKSEDREIQAAVLHALSRNEAALEQDAIAGFIHEKANDEESYSLLLPILPSDLFTDSQATGILLDLWSEVRDEDGRLSLMERLFARSSLVQTEKPSRDVVKLLKRASTDEVAALREDVFDRIEATESLRKSPRIGEVLLSGLADPSAGIRLKTLTLAQEQTEFWKEADTVEYLLKLLVDPDPKIRKLALESVEKFNLLKEEPRFAKRVKSLVEDSDLGDKSRSMLVAGGYDPNTIEGDASIQTFGIPDLDFFREYVNPYFYEAGADNHACVECHQNHNILRIHEYMGDGEIPDDIVIQNFNSALKVVNLADPEQSLILRKPRSPEGQGGESTESQTGLTHVGGPRWPSKTHPGYQAMLKWIQDAASSQDRRLRGTVSTDSFSPDYPPELALDNDPRTIWHTEFVGAMPGYPHEVVIDLGHETNTSAFQYVPRQDGANGRVKKWELYASADRENWGEPIAQGEWANDATVKAVRLQAEGVRYIRFRGLSSVNDEPFMSAAEVIVLEAKGVSPGS
ncbi:MAG: discoidin domain-containing protein, partial [Candidatus Omnitrophica bacterium]|nr:discoidin domain-containing protein [Candidatus Omnitrophota bacterium]